MHTEDIPPLLEVDFPRPSPVVTVYEDFKEYQNTMLPLQVYELWDNIIKEINTNPKYVNFLNNI